VYVSSSVGVEKPLTFVEGSVYLFLLVWFLVSWILICPC